MTAGANDDLTSGRVYKPCGFAQHTPGAALKHLDDVPTTGKRLSQCSTKPIRALMQAQVAGVRWTDDEDVDPTSAVGMIIPLGATLEYDGDLSKFRFIEDDAGAVLAISFYGV